MISPLLPHRETERLQVLHKYEILDTPPEDAYNQIVEQAAVLCETPMAAFSLIDEDRNWFKSRVGLQMKETERAVSFCAHAVASDAPLVVENASLDNRFAGNALVVGAPHTQFYAGIPVRAQTGEALGTLCVIDRKPRKFPWSDFQKLRDLAGEIETCLESRRAGTAKSEMPKDSQ